MLSCVAKWVVGPEIENPNRFQQRHPVSSGKAGPFQASAPWDVVHVRCFGGKDNNQT